MSEDHESPYEDPEAESASPPPRRGWFYYVAVFFLVLALVCFILTTNLNYHPGPLPPPVHPSTDK